MNDFLLSQYDFDLPDELIAQRPASPRDHSRLLIYKKSEDKIIHETFFNLAKYLEPNTTLIFNDTKVFPCRLLGKKPSGGKAEIFLLERNESESGLLKGLIKTSGKKKVGDRFIFENECQAELIEVGTGGVFYLKFIGNFEELIEKYAKIPIPPYIRSGLSDESDRSDYQTNFAKHTGSVAAPTAGLHFTDRVFADFNDKNIDRAFVTLHVGLGTFAPVKVDDIREHQMHEEDYLIEKAEWAKIMAAKKRIAVGTTSLRTLESVWSSKASFASDELCSTDIFLHPGKEIKSVSGLLTNFHLPKSTLLMLVSALIGREKLLEIYREAVVNQYRFFSYGDAMLILD